MRKTSAAALLAFALILSPAVAAQADVQAPAGGVLLAGESTADEEVTDTVDRTADEVEDGFDWGLLGLLGLAGLAGLAGRNRRDHVDTTHRDRDLRTDRETHRGNPLDRDGDGRVRDDAARGLDRDGDGRIG